MENIKLALLSLKKGISEGKAKANSDVNAAIIKLSAVLTFFVNAKLLRMISKS